MREVAFVTVYKKNFRESERLPLAAVRELHAVGVIEVAYKPNARGKLKPVYVSLDVMSKLRDLSTTMGPRVIEANAMGSRRHKALVAEWAPIRYATA